MRSIEKILHDYEICYFNEECSCDGCSYCKDGYCSDYEDNFRLEVYQHLREGYNNGMDVAWELAKNIKNMDAKDIQECFDVNNGFYGVMNKYKAQEAKSIYDEWKDKKKLNIGDVIRFNYSNFCAVVMRIIDDNQAYLLFSDGSCEQHELEDYKKIGHTDVTELLQTIDNFQDIYSDSNWVEI